MRGDAWDLEKKKHIGILIDPETHHILHYLAKYNGRSAHGHILYLIRQDAERHRREVGPIDPPKEKENK